MNNTTVLIPLERGWLAVIAQNPPLTALVSSLSAWRADEQRAVTLSREFALEPTDFCVRYDLLIDSVPDGTRVEVNGHEVATAGSDGLRLDVTDWVALEANSIRLRVEGGAEGAFAGVRLQGVPCE